MKTLIAILISTLVSPVFAKTVYVKGYYRKDGTYVQSHTRSSPDSYKWNNYGSSKGTYQSATLRDADRDGTPNHLDTDDDNDGVHDDDE